ncbi:MAG: tetratricopeptide repeat protein [Gemmatimonadaceae bacterium]
MRHLRRLTFSVSGVLMLGACTRTVTVASPGAVTDPAAVAAPAAVGSVQEIPVSTSSQSARDHFVTGQRLLDAGRTREANEHYRKAVEQDPTFAYAYLELAGSSASAQEFREYLDLAAKNIQGKSEGERMLVDISRTFMDNSIQKRLELQQALVRAYPNSARALLDLGFTQQGLKQHAAARESFRKALALDPNMFAAHSALRNSYTLQQPRDLALAKKHAELAIASAPDEAKGYEFLGDVYRAMNQLEDASKAYSRALEKDAGLAVANLKKGHINSFLGNQAEARTAYDAAITSSKEADKVTYGVYRAFVNVHGGDIPTALKELETVAQSVETSGIPEKQIVGSKIFVLSNAATIALHHDMVAEAEKIIDQLKVALKAEAATINDANSPDSRMPRSRPGRLRLQLERAIIRLHYRRQRNIAGFSRAMGIPAGSKVTMRCAG